MLKNGKAGSNSDLAQKFSTLLFLWGVLLSALLTHGPPPPNQNHAFSLPQHRRTRVSHLINAHMSVSLQTAKNPPPQSQLSKNDAKNLLLSRAHSHNDYHQTKPLLSALRHGMKSVEVDVFPRDGSLLVGHTRFELQSSRTIDNMYIRPILAMIEQSGSATQIGLKVLANSSKGPAVFVTGGQNAGAPPAATKRGSRLTSQRRGPRCPVEKTLSPSNDSDFRSASRRLAERNRNRKQKHSGRKKDEEDDVLTLLVDLKADPEESLHLLHKALTPIRPYLTKFDRHGKFVKGKVTVLISGNRPKNSSLYYVDGKSGMERYLFIDGRTFDIRSAADSSFVPLVSTPWRGKVQLAWVLGRGVNYIQQLADQAHNQGKRLRIWGAPNEERIWRHMISTDVDLVSIDDHARFAKFATRYKHGL